MQTHTSGRGKGGAVTSKIIVHLSDLHIRDRGREYAYAARVFKMVSSSYPGSPVLITGDVIDSGTEEEMACARGLLDTLAATNPILVVPGNHDYAWRGLVCRDSSMQQWVELLGSPLGWRARPTYPWLTPACEPKVDGLGVWGDGDFVYFGVDSGDPLDRTKTARGYVSSVLAEALHEELKKHANKCRIVMLHHHPFDDGPFMKLVGAELLIEAVSGRCELLLFGHDHHLAVWRGRNGIPLTVASHKTTDLVFEQHLMVNIIQISPGSSTPWRFGHRLELA